MTNVEVAAPVKRRWVRAVHRQKVCSEIRRSVVETMGVRVTRQERQPMRRPLGKGHMQAVIVGMVDVRQLVDLRQVGEFASEWLSGGFQAAVSAAGGLVRNRIRIA